MILSSNIDISLDIKHSPKTIGQAFAHQDSEEQAEILNVAGETFAAMGHKGDLQLAHLVRSLNDHGRKLIADLAACVELHENQERRS